MAPLAQFLTGEAKVDPVIVAYVVENLQLETVSDFANFWTNAEYEEGVKSDITNNVPGYEDASHPKTRVQVARLRTAWRLLRESVKKKVDAEPPKEPSKRKLDAEPPKEPSRKLDAAKQDPLSQPLLEGAKMGDEEEVRIEKAAWMLESALFHEDLPELLPLDLTGARAHHLLFLRAAKWHTFAVLCLVLLTFVEVPAWCSADGACTVPAGGNARLSGIPYLPPAVALAIELVLQIIILQKFVLEYTLEVWHFTPRGVEWCNKKLMVLGMCLAVGGVIDAIGFMVFRQPFRLSFIFRTGLVFLFPSVRAIFQRLFSGKVLEEVSVVALFLVGVMIVSAFIWFSTLGKDTTMVYKEDEELVLANHGFATFGAATYSMFVGAATGDFIDVLLPSFLTYRFTALFWVVYLVLTKVLLKNMVMDSLISQYMKSAEENSYDMAKRQASGMVCAFHLLAGEADSISRDTFFRFCRALQRSPVWGRIPNEALEVLYDGTEGASKARFCELCDILQGRVQVLPELARAGLKPGACADRWRSWILEPEDFPCFDKLMNYVLLLNLVLMVIEGTYDVMKWDEPFWTDYLELSFAFAYLAEVCCKLSVKTFAEYWYCASNKFDFVTTWLMLALSLLPYLPSVSLEADLAHYANILRLARLFKVLKQLKSSPSIQFMVDAITRMVSAGRDIISLLGLFFFFFCGLSVNLYGGVLYEGNPKLEGTEYAKKHWYILNFNDMFMATATYVVQVLCEYVPAMADALHKASSWPRLSWWVFVAFYAVTSCIMFELLLAFTVDIYMTCKKEKDAGEKDAGEKDAAKDAAEKPEPSEAAHKDEKPKEGEKGEEEDKAEFVQSKFFEGLQEKLGSNTSYNLHWQSGVLASFSDAVHEEYEEVLEEAHHEPQERPDSREREAVCWAAWLFSLGVSGLPVGEKPTDVVEEWAKHVTGLQARAHYGRLMALLVALTFLETPAWCRSPGEESSWRGWAFMPGAQRCPAPPQPGADWQLSGLPYLPPGLALALEIALLMAIGRSFLFQYKLGTERGWACAGMLLVACNLLDAAGGPLLGATARWTCVFRTGLLYLMPDVRAFVERVFNRQCLGEFGFTAQIFILAVLLFTWIVFTLIRNADVVSYTEGGSTVYMNEGFESLQRSTYTMFLAATTEGFTDIMMPTMLVSPAYGLLWLVFLLTTQVLLLNLVIDTFVAAFLEASEKLTDFSARMQAESIMKVFKVLAPKGSPITATTTIPQETLLDWGEELSRSPLFTTPRHSVQAMLEHFGAVNRENICDMCLLLQCNVQVIKRDSPLKATAPQLWDSPYFQRLRRAAWEPKGQPALDVFYDRVLLANLVFMAVQFARPHDQSTVMVLTNAIFTFAYIVEVALKLSVKSWEEYWYFGSNRLDFVATWLQLGTLVSTNRHLAPYTNLLRLVRLVRPLRAVLLVARKFQQTQSFQFMINVLARMFLGSKTIFCTMGIALFFFATLCTNCFGGMIFKGNPQLEGSAMEEKHWTVLNFNDMPMALFTWFLQVLFEYSPELAHAIYVTSPMGEIAWWIVPAFYLIVVAIMFEILAAFTIEMFLALKEEAERSSEESGTSGEEEEDEGDEDASKEVDLAKEMQAKLGYNQKLHIQLRKDDIAFRRKLRQEFGKGCEEGAKGS